MISNPSRDPAKSETWNSSNRESGSDVLQILWRSHSGRQSLLREMRQTAWHTGKSQNGSDCDDAWASHSVSLRRDSPHSCFILDSVSAEGDLRLFRDQVDY